MSMQMEAEQNKMPAQNLVQALDLPLLNLCKRQYEQALTI
jgi:hypothetical protein